jgi:type IX secretion system PorP/SprF family membrane protein
MKNYIIFSLFFLGFTTIQAQQEAHYSLFMLNNLQTNPGFAGSRRVASFNTIYRNQWVGFKGNPRSFVANFDAPLPNKPKLGVGFTLSSQAEGIARRMALTPSVSYAILQTDESTLRVGINASYRQYQFNLNTANVNINERQDPSLGADDKPSISNMNVGFGVYYDRKNIYAGLSIPNLNQNPLILNDNAKVKLKGTERRHIYAMVGGLFPLGDNENIQLKPSMLLKYVAHAPFSVDVNASVLFKKKFMGGVSYRFGNTSGDSVDFLGFFQVKENFSIGMAYDFTLSQIGLYNRSSVEMVARYDFALKANDMHNPRFFF